MTTSEIQKIDKILKILKTGKCDNDCMTNCPIFFECMYEYKDNIKDIAKDKLLEIKIKMI